MSKTEEIDLGELGSQLWTKRYSVLGCALTMTIVAYIATRFFMTPMYESRTVFVESADGAGSRKLDSIASDSTVSMLLNFATKATSLNLYLQILKSHSFALGIVREKDFLEQFEGKLDGKTPLEIRQVEERVIDEIQKRTKIKADEGAVFLSYRDINPERSFQIINLYLNHLREFIRGSSITKAKNTEIFVAERLREIEATIKDLEENYLSQKKRRGVVLLPSQIGLSLSAASKLRSQILEKELEIDLYRSIMKNSDDVNRLQSEKAQIQSRLNDIVRGIPVSRGEANRMADGTSKSNVELLTPLSQGTELEMEFSKIERHYGMMVKLSDLLRQHLELARIESRSSEMIFQVLDEPYPALGPVFPNRNLNLLVGFLIGAFGASVWVLFKSRRRNLRSAKMRAVAN